MEAEPSFDLGLTLEEPPAKQGRFASVTTTDVHDMLSKRMPSLNELRHPTSQNSKVAHPHPPSDAALLQAREFNMYNQ